MARLSSCGRQIYFKEFTIPLARDRPGRPNEGLDEQGLAGRTPKRRHGGWRQLPWLGGQGSLRRPAWSSPCMAVTTCNAVRPDRSARRDNLPKHLLTKKLLAESTAAPSGRPCASSRSARRVGKPISPSASNQGACISTPRALWKSGGSRHPGSKKYDNHPWGQYGLGRRLRLDHCID